MNMLLKTVAALALPLMLAGCGDAPEPSASAAAAAPSSWRLDTAPPDAMDVLAAKASATEGQTIAIRGRIGGRVHPIAPEAGLFIVMDPSLPSCADTGDGCGTPWDYCCEAPQTIADHGATVQLRDAAGTPIRLQPGDLTPLDEVIVRGTVAPRPNDQILVLHGSNIYIAPRNAQ